MIITTDQPLTSDLKVTEFTVKTEEPLSLQEVFNKLSELHSSSKQHDYNEGFALTKEEAEEIQRRFHLAWPLVEDKKDQFHPCKEDDQEDFRAVCPECQRLINPFEHVCEGLQPRFYLEDLVDWDEAPPHANWAAQDANGVIWFYGSKPFLDAASGRWIGTGGDTWYTYSVALAIDWKKPLPRPNQT